MLAVLDEANEAPDGREVKVWNKPGDDRRTMSIPAPDPGELWTDMNTQKFGEPNPAAGAPAAGAATGICPLACWVSAQPSARWPGAWAR